jgi:benzoylformate decarboxylase
MDDWTHGCGPVSARKVTTRVLPDPAALNEVVTALTASTSPAIVAGAQIERDNAWSEVIALAEHLDADVYQDPIPSRWTFPRSHRLFRGGLLAAQQPLCEQLASYDVVIVLGAPIFLYYSYVPGSPIAGATKLFQITDSSDDAAAGRAKHSWRC